MTIANVKGNNVIMFFSELKGKVSQKMSEKYVTPHTYKLAIWSVWHLPWL